MRCPPRNSRTWFRERTRFPCSTEPGSRGLRTWFLSFELARALRTDEPTAHANGLPAPDMSRRASSAALRRDLASVAWTRGSASAARVDRLGAVMGCAAHSVATSGASSMPSVRCTTSHCSSRSSDRRGRPSTRSPIESQWSWPTRRASPRRSRCPREFVFCRTASGGGSSAPGPAGIRIAGARSARRWGTHLSLNGHSSRAPFARRSPIGSSAVARSLRSSRTARSKDPQGPLLRSRSRHLLCGPTRRCWRLRTRPLRGRMSRASARKRDGCAAGSHTTGCPEHPPPSLAAAI
jgi:hypothetical protein